MSDPTKSAELPPQLEAAIGQVRAALLPGADATTKAAAALSCRVLLGVLDAQPGQPIQVGAVAAASPTPSSASAVALPLPPVAPIDLLLTRFIAKHGGDLPPDPSVPFVEMGRAILVQTLGVLR